MFKFTIRELLLLTVIAGLAVGWWIDRTSLAKEAETARAKLIAFKNSSAERWREIALSLGHLMRGDGWYVHIDDDGSGWGYTSRTSISRKTADELNSKKPLALPDNQLMIQ